MARRLRFSPKSLELTRAHHWQGKKNELLYDILRLEPRHTVVDVGCGTGAFTRILAERLDKRKRGKIVGVDRDAKLLAAARELASEYGLASRIEFRQGDAKSLPFPDGFADRVVCQAVLWLMTHGEREAALKEMIRICKKGGLVAAVEGSIDTSVTWFPDDPRLTDLYARQTKAMIEGYKRVYGYDRSIGYKLPSLFSTLGLTGVRLDGVADARLRLDDRFPLSHTRDVIGLWYLRYPKQLLSKLDRMAGDGARRAYIEKSEPILTAGGMTWAEIIELNRLKIEYGTRLLKGSRAVRHDATVEAGISFVATGIKP